VLIAPPAPVIAPPAPPSASDASPLVVDAVQRASIAAAQGDRRGAQLAMRDAQRAERISPVLRVARIAMGHRLLPAVALRLDATQLEAVLAHDRDASSNHTVGHVVGVLGAIGGLVGLVSIFLSGAFSSTGRVGDGAKLLAGGFGGAGVALALLGILFHVQGSAHEGEVEAMLQVTPTTGGASLMFSARL
jgi:hypothetical protein